jgi:hypothetical protein
MTVDRNDRDGEQPAGTSDMSPVTMLGGIYEVIAE